MSPNVCFLTGTPLISPSSTCCTDTRATLPDGGKVGPSVITTAWGVRLMIFIYISSDLLFYSLVSIFYVHERFDFVFRISIKVIMEPRCGVSVDIGGNFPLVAELGHCDVGVESFFQFFQVIM